VVTAVAASSDPGPAPAWVFGEGPAPDFVQAWLCLDYGDDLSRVGPVIQMWHDEAVARLYELVQPAGSARPTLRRSGYLEDAEGTGREIRPRAWADGIVPDYNQLSWLWHDTAPAAAVSELRLYAFRFVDRRHVMLSVTADMENRPGRLTQVLPPLLEFLRTVADVADPAYGEVVVNGESIAPVTMLDSALLRHDAVSAGESRTYLRGYEWVTVCPKELAGRLGGVEGLRASGAFAEVTPLRQGGAVLRATDDPAAYGPDQVSAVFGALAPVLPSGPPRHAVGRDLSRLLLADASEYARPDVPPELGAGIASPNDPQFAPIQEFIVQAATNGWMVETADGGFELSAEGQRRYDEIVEAAKRGGTSM